jgi:16S rRNA C1402 (ribose-2'-O) methylase RsmI
VSQLRATKLEEALHVKETEIQDTTQKMAVIQHETDAITLEKLEFLTMIQGLQHEAEQQQKHLLEVMNINQELLDFSEKKENEVKPCIWEPFSSLFNVYVFSVPCIASVLPSSLLQKL